MPRRDENSCLRFSSSGALDIISSAAQICDEIDLELFSLRSAVGFQIGFHHADVHGKPAQFQLVIDDVLHDVVVFLLTERKPRIS